MSIILVYIDDFNAFDYIIDMLVDACDHTPEQIEQCAVIVHYKEKCTVKTGPY